jgi:hypothetical protein
MLNALVVMAMMWIAVLTQVGQAGPKPTQAPLNNDVETCPDTRTPLDDMSLVLDHYGPAFRRDSWSLSVTDNWASNNMMFVWSPSNGATSIASAVLLMWPCGVTDEQVEAYYTDETLDIVVGAYDSHTLTASCTIGGVRIYDFDLSRQDGDYAGRFWVEIVGPTRVVQGNLTVPANEAASLDDYGRILYPRSFNCDKR